MDWEAIEAAWHKNEKRQEQVDKRAELLEKKLARKPEVAEAAPYPLASLYAPDLEALARDTYARDYVGYGFGDWAA